jgi:glycosyltransferase involved in cell wall biosynthesis
VEKGPHVNQNRATRVGFIVPQGLWRGGRNYLRSLFSGIHAIPGLPLTPVIIVGETTDDIVADFPGIEVVQTSILDRKSPAWFAQKILARTTGRDISLLRLLRKHDIAVLSHCFRLDSRVGIPSLGWIPDLQHVRLPQFFTEAERRLRDSEYRSLCNNCDKVLVSSKSARADLIAFSPEHQHKAELLNFVAFPPPVSLNLSLQDLQSAYNFHESYFVLPNQFWAHKNHRVVVSALKILKQRGRLLLVLATGSSEDSRNPTFFPELMQYAAECGVLDCFRVLGVVPFNHLAELMRHSIAVINPSLFEGWSTSVEESKSMGKQVILSDIEVHREQAPDRGIYFPATDPAALADAMIVASDGFDPDHDFVIQAAAMDGFADRLREFGEAYHRIVASVQHSA